jgi:hypothetical protein
MAYLVPGPASGKPRFWPDPSGHNTFVGTASSAQLKVLLAGIELPAEKPALLEHAVRKRAEPQLIDALQSLPAREYGSLDEVLDELLRVER